MSRKDYQSIADALVRAQFRMEDTLGNVSMASMCAYDVADSLAREFARTNQNFNRDLFMKACGLEEAI